MDEITLFFAKIASAYLVITGLGFLISTDFYDKMVRGNASTDPVTLNLSGAAHFLVGMTILVQHFRWGSLAEAVVTLVGLGAALKGAGLIATPKLMLRSPKTDKSTLQWSGVGFIMLGIYLGYVGFLRMALPALSFSFVNF